MDDTTHEPPPLEPGERARLDAAYRATTYVAELPDGPVELRVDHPNPRLDALLREHRAQAWAYVTAWNPWSEAFPDERNRDRQRSLEHAFAERNVTFFRGTSRPDAPLEGEESVLAFLGRDTALDLGKRYGQNALVVGVLGGPAELVWLR